MPRITYTSTFTVFNFDMRSISRIECIANRTRDSGALLPLPAKCWARLPSYLTTMAMNCSQATRDRTLLEVLFCCSYTFSTKWRSKPGAPATRWTNPRREGMIQPCLSLAHPALTSEAHHQNTEIYSPSSEIDVYHNNIVDPPTHGLTSTLPTHRNHHSRRIASTQPVPTRPAQRVYSQLATPNRNCDHRGNSRHIHYCARPWQM